MNGVSLVQNFKYNRSFPNNHSPCRKTRWMDLLYSIRIFAEVSFVFSHFTRLLDGQTDGRTFRLWLIPPCIVSSAVKSFLHLWQYAYN